MTDRTERSNDEVAASSAGTSANVASSSPASAVADTTPIDQLSFDDALAAFQRTVAELEMGGLPLERSIALYERGAALHERCAKLLAEAELRVQQLVTRAGGVLETIDVAPDAARDTE